jgi:hypothetical protein
MVATNRIYELQKKKNYYLAQLFKIYWAQQIEMIIYNTLFVALWALQPEAATSLPTTYAPVYNILSSFWKFKYIKLQEWQKHYVKL